MNPLQAHSVDRHRDNSSERTAYKKNFLRPFKTPPKIILYLIKISLKKKCFAKLFFVYPSMLFSWLFLCKYNFHVEYHIDTARTHPTLMKSLMMKQKL